MATFILRGAPVPTDILEFYLEKDENDHCVYLMANDREGRTWCILKISPQGTISRSVGLRAEGFQVNDEGQILIDGYGDV